MNAPDKIYLHPNYKGEVGANWLTFSLTNEDVCYINKDVLLEWANEQIKVAKVNNLAYSLFEKLVNKLNSL